MQPPMKTLSKTEWTMTEATLKAMSSNNNMMLGYIDELTNAISWGMSVDANLDVRDANDLS